MSRSYRICVAGLGSIGRRHVKNIAAYCAGRGYGCSIDAFRSGSGAVPDAETQRLLSGVLHDPSEIPGDYDAVFIANPTSLHYGTLAHFAGKSRAFFVEKPVFAPADLRRPLPDGVDPARVYVACPLRYSDAVRGLRESVDPREVIHVRAICSSYLPDWRPGADYRKTYSAQTALGGGVALDLVHEWDYLVWLFGMPDEVKSIRGRVSALEIDSDDIAVYIARYPGMTLELHLDYFGRVPERAVTVYTNDGATVTDIEGGDRNDMYERETALFFDVLEGRADNPNTVGHAAAVTRLALGEGGRP